MLRYFELTKCGLSQNHEMTVIHKNGHHVILDVTSVPIIVDGTIVGIYGIGKDITEHKKAQNALEQLRYKNELILRSAGEGIFGLDRQGLITFCNPAASRLLGFEIEELIGKDAHSTLHYMRAEESYNSREKCLIHQSLSSGISHHVEEDLFWRKDGTFCSVEYVITPIQEKDEIVGGVVIFKDITERKRTEEYLRKTEKLSVVGQLAAGVAHEIRNPLTSLRGFVQLLRSRISEHTDYFEVMLSEIDRINSIVSEFLFLAKPQVVHFQPKDPRLILKDIIALLDTQAILYNIRIVSDFAQELPLVNCDENQLKQVFINILKNSMEAMPKGGDIIIEAKLSGQDQVLVRFVDHGLGIPEDRLPKLGEPFYTTKEKGTGLGLMVSYKIIEAHQGKIHITSQLQKGTRVDVLLPVQEQVTVLG
jgi:PAS domain S-box-containing protein